MQQNRNRAAQWMIVIGLVMMLSAAIHFCALSDQSELETKTITVSAFVRITDRNGNVYMFRPHMVTQIISETNGCHIDVAGIGAIRMACSIDEAAKLVKAR